MPLTAKQRQQLKAKAHALRPVVLIGNHGLTEAVIQEIDIALTAHELIKIKIAGQEKAIRQAFLTQICDRSRAELVQAIGSVGVIYRKRQE